MKTYSILDDNWNTTFSTNTFDKEILTGEFEKTIRAAKEGETIQYGWEDSKYAFGASLVVEIRRGKAMLCVFKGDKCFYKDYQFKTSA